MTLRNHLGKQGGSLTNAQKKVVILLVEGDTDETLLIERLRQLFNDKEIRFEPYRGDIFYQIDQKSKPIKKLIGDKVKEVLIKRRFNSSDILVVLHILDTDGCFVGPSNITIDAEQNGLTKYLEGCISVSSETQKGKMEERNLVRSRNIQIMKSAAYISTFSYQLYYFSRNLEHVLFNEMNPEKGSKMEKVEDFLDDLTMPVEEFLNQFMPVPRNESCEDTYKASWDFISEDINSLKRATNVPLIFDYLNELG